jgi:hypothetical protein
VATVIPSPTEVLLQAVDIKFGQEHSHKLISSTYITAINERVFGSNLIRDTGYSNWGFSGFPQLLQKTAATSS